MRALLIVTSSEGVDFSFELAGVATRAWAKLIDYVIMFSLIAIIGCLVAMLGASLGGWAAAILIVSVFLIQWWYATLLEWRWAGQTVGKRFAGVRVMDMSGVPITFPQAVIRNLVGIIDILPAFYLTGVTSMVTTRDQRRLGDLAAGTIVVRNRTAPLPRAMAGTDERDAFSSSADVRVAVRRISAQEREAMIELGLRRERLPMAKRTALFEQLAAHLERSIGIAKPAHFTAEKYVLLLTATLLSGERA